MIVRSEKFHSNPAVVCSIIVYNQKQWISQCIDGMLEQKFSLPFTIVISDDNSTDGTQEVLLEYQRKYPEKIKLVLNEKNGGIASNWVSCCRAFEGGKYIAFCDGDDFWSNPEKLQIQYDYMENHAECVVLSTNCNTIDDNGNIRYSVNKGLSKQGNIQEEMWNHGGLIIPTSNTFYRKSVFDEHMPLDAFVEHDFPFQDWPSQVVMAAYGEFHYLPISTSTYRIGHESDSHACDLAKLERRMRRIKGMNVYLHGLFPYLEFSADDYDRYMYGFFVPLCVKNGDYKLAKKYAKMNKEHTLRNVMCYTWLTFQIYRAIKSLKAKVK